MIDGEQAICQLVGRQGFIGSAGHSRSSIILSKFPTLTLQRVTSGWLRSFQLPNPENDPCLPTRVVRNTLLQ